jgi:hypothetical protein
MNRFHMSLSIYLRRYSKEARAGTATWIGKEGEIEAAEFAAKRAAAAELGGIAQVNIPST